MTANLKLETSNSKLAPDSPYLARVKAWERAAPLLEKIRWDSLRDSSTPDALRNLSDAFESCRRLNRPKKWSGLVEQQRYFMKARV